MPVKTRRPAAFLATGMLAVVAVSAAGSARGAEPPVDFSRDILPILSDNCFHCHGPDQQHREADLRLDEEASAKQLRDGVAAIVPGRSDASHVYRRITSTDPEEVMPPADSPRKLTAEQIGLLKRWIDEGAAWGRHWAYQPLERPARPTPPKFAERVRNPIDSFVLARLMQEGLAPAPEASRETLIRRATLDLTGLPPTPDEVDAFVRDPAPDAYERLIDRLLASPAFGERMTWDWLDAARYADSNGYQDDNERTMWPWRDWVVQAFNKNLPYDQFTVWQLAGDLLPGATVEQRLATAFCRNHMINGEGGRIPEENRVDYVMDMAETIGTVWLGLTLNCCRCHDHKFDPLTRRDYYGMFAFFNQTPVDGSGRDPQTPPVLEVPSDEHVQQAKEADAAVAAAAEELEKAEIGLFPRLDGEAADQSAAAANLPDNLRAILRLSAASRKNTDLAALQKHWAQEKPEYVKLVARLNAAIDSRTGLARGVPRVMVMADQPQARQTFLLEKGLYDKPGEAVSAAVPARLPPLPAGSTPNRLTLARWLFSADQPLTARVTVNRFWQQFFGIGLVKTSEDFGVQSERPVHRELLDWLAAEFRDSRWDVKALIRLMVTSHAYRQSSRATPQLIERDPENRLLARGPRYRLPAWVIRDQALAASGLLVRRLGGPPVKPYQPAGVWEEATFGQKKYREDAGEALYRRSLYTFWRRIVGPTMFFDNAARQVCSVKPSRTNTPLHALATLNDVTYVEAARVLAERVIHEAGDAPEARIERACRLVLARRPAAEELQTLLHTLHALRRQFEAAPDDARKLLEVGRSPRDQRIAPAEHAAYAALCSVLLNLDETLTRH